MVETDEVPTEFQVTVVGRPADGGTQMKACP